MTGVVPSTWPLGACAIGYFVDTRDVEVEALENNNALGLSGACAVDGSYQSFGAGCVAVGRAPVAHSGVGTPRVGADAILRVSNAVPSRPLVLLIGGSNTTWNSLRLPLGLGFLGAAGCRLAVSPDASVPAVADVRGQFTMRIPLSIRVAGNRFFSQFAATGARNRLTIATSNGVETQIGN